MKYKCDYISKLGKIILFSDGIFLTGLYFDTCKYLKNIEKEDIIYNNNLEIFKKTKNCLDNYFFGNFEDFKDIPIKLEGSLFAKEVWEELLKIPYGETLTYGEIAKIIGKRRNKKMSSQAVGHAVGLNPISIIIPCHRVIGSKNKLVGYSAGLDKKINLLKIEKIDI